jgi:hypothetical protein
MKATQPVRTGIHRAEVLPEFNNGRRVTSAQVPSDRVVSDNSVTARLSTYYVQTRPTDDTAVTVALTPLFDAVVVFEAAHLPGRQPWRFADHSQTAKCSSSEMSGRVASLTASFFDARSCATSAERTCWLLGA